MKEDVNLYNLKSVIDWWNEIPDAHFTEDDFYKCKGCGIWDLKHGYEDTDPYCIGCVARKCNCIIS